jgi:ribosome-binding protein aMBF1 (putative translation factor)
MNPSDDSQSKRKKKEPLTWRSEWDPACKLFRERMKAAMKRDRMGFTELAHLTRYGEDQLERVRRGASTPSQDLMFRVTRVLHLDLNEMVRDSAGG